MLETEKQMLGDRSSLSHYADIGCVCKEIYFVILRITGKNSGEV